MSEPNPVPAQGKQIDLLIEPEVHDLGSFSVRRVLPAKSRKMVGPFIFFDHMGPAEFAPGDGISVRPHPHIGLSTVTYLFEGEIMHRDSLGFVQPIQAGAVNLMTAGRGIVHSERAGDDLDSRSRLHGIQSWMALPREQEEIDPAFVHFAAASLPRFERDGVEICVIMGEAYGQESPVTQYAPTLYLELKMSAGSSITLPGGYEQVAAYVVDGEVGSGAEPIAARTMAVAADAASMKLEAAAASHVMVIGGAAFDQRHIWWNFVSSSKTRIEQASEDWRNMRFDLVPGDDEFIPLP